MFRTFLDSVEEQLARGVFLLFAAAVGWLAWSLKNDGELDGTGAVGLAAAVLIGILLAFGGPDWLKRIKSIGPQGIELAVLSERVGSLPRFAPQELQQPGIRLEPAGSYDGKLTAEQQWLYERGTNMVLDFQDGGRDVRELSGNEQDDYRRIVTWVGRAALLSDENVKALEILRFIEDLPELHVEELYNLGLAYMRVASFTEIGQREALLHRARRLLQDAVKRDEGYAPSHYALGYVNHQLTQYTEAIKHTSKAIELDQSEYRLAYWNLARSLVMSNKLADALVALRSLAALPEHTWKSIYDDTELEALKEDDGLKAEFQELYERGAGITPPALAGVAGVDIAGVERSRSRIMAAVGAGAIVVGYAAWYARRRRSARR